MTTEITDACNRYYLLNEKLLAQEQALQNLLDNPLLYFGQTALSAIDAIISHQRDVEAAQAEVNTTMDEIDKTGQIIQAFMKQFNIPGGLQLTGVIPFEAEYAVWTDDNDEIQIRKTKDLTGVPKDPNLIIIKMTNGDILRIQIDPNGRMPVSSEEEVGLD